MNAISLFALYPFSVNNVVLLVSLDYFAHLLTFMMRTLPSFQMGLNEALYLCLSTLEKEGDISSCKCGEVH